VNRQSLGYQREFLDNYRPNETWYLTKEDRHKLLALGTIQEEIRPAGTYANQILNRLLIDLSWISINVFHDWLRTSHLFKIICVLYLS